MQNIKALRAGKLELIAVTETNLDTVRNLLKAEPDSGEVLEEFEASYLPNFDTENRPVRYSFYILKEGKMTGLTLLDIDSWEDARGSTGADILPGCRGQGIAPASKIPLFYLGFGLLGLNRIETGHYVSNRASQRSIEKTAGFIYEGRLREYGRNPAGEFEDVLYYGIIRRDWEALYREVPVEVIYE